MKSMLFVLLVVASLCIESFAQEDKALPTKNALSHQQAEVIVNKMKLDGKDKAFILKVLPAITDIHNKYENYYQRAKMILSSKQPTNDNIEWIKHMKKCYDASSDKALLAALKPFPRSIALAQAALESGWGTSRFFKQGNNIFGVHAFSPDVPRIKALQKNNGYTVWVRKYANLDQSIDGYYYFLATKRAFDQFRELKMQSNDPYKITRGLYLYSALGNKYSQILNEMIKNHRFYVADTL